MPSRRVKSLRHGPKKVKDGVVWHREHRSKKNRKHKFGAAYHRFIKRKKEKMRLKELEKESKEALYG